MHRSSRDRFEAHHVAYVEDGAYGLAACHARTTWHRFFLITSIVVALLGRESSALERLGQPGAVLLQPIVLLMEHYEDSWLASYDPTLLGNRLLSELSWEDREAGSSIWKWENTLRLALPVREDLAAGIQVMTPWVAADREGMNEEGFGDLEARAGIVRRVAHGLRCGVGVNAVFDTATDPLLGSGVFELRPIVALRWDAAKRLQLGLNGEYTFTPQDEADGDVSAFEARLQAAVKLTKSWSSAVTYKPRWDFLAENMRHRLEAVVTCVWGGREQHAFSLGAEVPLSSQSLDCKLIAGFAWYF